jgi:hypothetical protein
VTKIIIAILGILLLLLGLSSLLLLRQDRLSALEVDTNFNQSESAQPDSCRNIIQTVALSNRVMTEKESQTLRIVLANTEGVETCHTAVRLAAVNFEVAPPAAERLVALEPGGNPVTLLWILKPKETGSFELAVTAGSETWILGIVVTNVLGFTAVQVQILSYISSLLGPMLTAPWWYEQWQKRQAAKIEAAEKALNAARLKEGPKGKSAEGFRPE